jgi:hypothetical protein
VQDAVAEACRVRLRPIMMTTLATILGRLPMRAVGRLVYHKMAERPEKVYGQAIGSSYQYRGLTLSKQFMQPPITGH